MIYEILSKRKGQAIKADEMLLLCGLPNDRALRKQVELERIDGRVICGTSRGYYIPETPEEVRAFVKVMESRAITTFRSIKAARALLKEMESGADPGTDPGERPGSADPGTGPGENI